MKPSVYKRPHGIMFHHFHNETIHPIGQGSISGPEFKKMLLGLKENYNIIKANEWCQKAISNTLSENEICITFDDNLRCQYDIALPVLKELNITAFWFLYTSPLEGIFENLERFRYFRSKAYKNINQFYEAFDTIFKHSVFYDQQAKDALAKFEPKEYNKHFAFYTDEDKIFRYTRDFILGTEKYNELMETLIKNSDVKIPVDLWMSKQDIKYLHNSGHIIGLHSHTHPTILGKLDYATQKLEYDHNAEILSSIVNSKIETVSYPCNSYNNDTLEIMKELNVKLGFRANMEEGFNSSLEHARIDHALLMDYIK